MTRATTSRKPIASRVRRAPDAVIVIEGASRSLADAITAALAIRGDQLKEALLTRWVVTATDALNRVPASKLGEAAAASTNAEAILRVLETPEMLDSTAPETALAAARARGVEARQQLLVAEGEPWTADQVASHLRISRQAVDKRRKAGKLLALTVGRRGYLYPAWQFARQGVLPGWETVLRVVAEPDPWARVIFMLSPNDRLDHKRPLDALRNGNIADVKIAASMYGEHGAA